MQQDGAVRSWPDVLGRRRTDAKAAARNRAVSSEGLPARTFAHLRSRAVDRQRAIRADGGKRFPRRGRSEAENVRPTANVTQQNNGTTAPARRPTRRPSTQLPATPG